MHLSKQQAAERATQIAAEFMQSQDTKGWDWALGGAKPDPIDPKNAGRKLATQWIVLVRYTKDGATLDGDAVIKVNLVNGSVAWSGESP